MPPLRPAKRPRVVKATLPRVQGPQAAPRPDSENQDKDTLNLPERVPATASLRPDRLSDALADSIFKTCW